MRRISTFMFLLLLGTTALVSADPAASPSPAPAQSTSPAAASPVEIAKSRIDTMLRTGHADPGWFSASFLAQVPASKVDEIIAQLTAQLGEYKDVEFTPAAFVAHFAKGTDDILIHLDAANQIDGLFFRPPSLAATSLDGALRALQKQQGTLSYVIAIEGRSDRAAFNASVPLAVGSAFKLAVIDALQDEIRSGARRWSDVVPLRPQWKSLPSGVLSTWPDATPLTLATYAAEMISISDNTAADALIRLVGPKALKPYAGENEPFLTTREMFILKSSETTGEERHAYLSARTPQARAAILARVDARALPGMEELLSAPVLGIEWHYSVRQLCRLMSRVADLPVMSINPGVANAAAFRHVAFKGGSDTGVINLTTMVATKRGSTVCFSATLNDAAHSVDEQSFESAYAAVLAGIANL